MGCYLNVESNYYQFQELFGSERQEKSKLPTKKYFDDTYVSIFINYYVRINPATEISQSGTSRIHNERSDAVER